MKKKHSLSDEKRPEFYQGLSGTFKKKLVVRKGLEYYLRGQAARTVAAVVEAVKPASSTYEYMGWRRSVLPEIGELRCRDLKAETLRAVLRKHAQPGKSYEVVIKIRFR